MIYIQKVILYLSLKVQKKEKKNLNYVISVANQKIVNFFKDMTISKNIRLFIEKIEK